ncbi:MAG: hypothetical protein GVY13_03510, partial [Alphaproteobacteria bacterium]|nr:hypothetical protein [Alphaproteobacteria bacterium]
MGGIPAALTEFHPLPEKRGRWNAIVNTTVANLTSFIRFLKSAAGGTLPKTIGEAVEFHPLPEKRGRWNSWAACSASSGGFIRFLKSAAGGTHVGTPFCSTRGFIRFLKSAAG